MLPTLFHLHFNTPDVTGAADRLADAGVPLRRRFGSVRGDGVALDPGDSPPEDFRLKLQVHQSGAVNITLGPGQHPHFDHIGLCVREEKTICDRAESRGWSVRSNERRTFVMTPWSFRVEIHPPTSDVVTRLGRSETRLENVSLCLPEATRTQKTFESVFGSVPELRIVTGEEAWIDEFTISGETTTTVTVGTLLGTQGAR